MAYIFDSRCRSLNTSHLLKRRWLQIIISCSLNVLRLNLFAFSCKSKGTWGGLVGQATKRIDKQQPKTFVRWPAWLTFFDASGFGVPGAGSSVFGSLSSASSAFGSGLAAQPCFAAALSSPFLSASRQMFARKTNKEISSTSLQLVGSRSCTGNAEHGLYNNVNFKPQPIEGAIEYLSWLCTNSPRGVEFLNKQTIQIATNECLISFPATELVKPEMWKVIRKSRAVDIWNGMPNTDVHVFDAEWCCGRQARTARKSIVNHA